MKGLRKFFSGLVSRVRDRKGQTVIEYVLVIVLIALVLVLAFRSDLVSKGVGRASWDISNQIGGAPGEARP